MTDAPRLHQNSQTVTLSFDSTLIQSTMLLADPHELVLDYTKAMMGALLFNHQPAAVLMIGLGGGSMLKYLHKHVPEADLTVVEISQGVIDLRDEFHIPPDGDRLRIVCADGTQFVRKPPRAYDLILVDGFNGQGIAEDLCSRSFYTNCRQALAPSGLMVANVQADTNETREILRRMGQAFDGCVITAESDEGGNEIAFAGAHPLFQDALAQFEARWAALPPAHQDTLAACSSRIQRGLMKMPRPHPR